MLARRLLPSLCPLLWDVESTVRETAFDVVQSLLNRIFAGHQEWTKSGVEPKKPVDPPKAPQGVMGVTGSYVSSAVSWVTGSLLGKGTETKPTTATTTTTTTTATSSTADSTAGQPPKAISSSTVNSVLPVMAKMELSMEELEAMGKPSATGTAMTTEMGRSSLKHAESNVSMGEDDMWGDSTAGSTASATVDWNSGWADEEDGEEKDLSNKSASQKDAKSEKDAVASMGGWGDTDLAFSDEETEETKKEDANLELIRRMAKKEEVPTTKPALAVKRMK